MIIKGACPTDGALRVYVIREIPLGFPVSILD